VRVQRNVWGMTLNRLVCMRPLYARGRRAQAKITEGDRRRWAADCKRATAICGQRSAVAFGQQQHERSAANPRIALTDKPRAGPPVGHRADDDDDERPADKVERKVQSLAVAG